MLTQRASGSGRCELSRPNYIATFKLSSRTAGGLCLPAAIAVVVPSATLRQLRHSQDDYVDDANNYDVVDDDGGDGDDDDRDDVDDVRD